ncbi:MAG: sigma-70 family RNA polymerase sigma factor [Opitutaceae bacterium]
MLDDAELLRRFAEEGSAKAFDDLARKHLDLIYSVALRRCGGDAFMAKDVTQMVLLYLARKARSLQQRASIVGWLHTTTRYAAATFLRDERTRKVRETASATLLPPEPSETLDATWQKLRPVLDDALGELRESEREAVLLRYFAGHSYADVGRALRLTETAARARVDRALDRLRGALARRGIESTVAALGTTILQGATTRMPPEFAAAAIGAAVADGLGSVAGVTGMAGGGFFSAGKLAALAAEIFVMKTATVFLVSSLAANAVLGSLYSARREPVPDYARLANVSMAPLAEPSPEPRSDRSNAISITPTATTAAKLDLTDQATLIRKMEDDGFDRASIARAILALYVHHSRPWMNEQLATRRSLERRWNLRPIEPDGQERRRRYQQRDAEAVAAVVAAGYDAADLGPHYSALAANSSTAFLSKDRAAAVRRIEKDYAELSGSVNTTSIRWDGTDRKSAGILWPEFAKDIRAALSPAEATLYFRNQSPAADEVQRALRKNSTFDVAPETYGAIVDDVVAGKALPVAFRQHLGDERFVRMLEGLNEVAASADTAYRGAGLSVQRRADLFLQASSAMEELRRAQPTLVAQRAQQLHDDLVQAAGLRGSELEAFHATRLGRYLREGMAYPPR